MSIATLPSSSPVVEKSLAAKNVFSAALAGGLVAAVANYLVYFIAEAAGVDFLGKFDGHAVGHLPVPMIGVSSIVPGLIGALGLVGLNAVMARPLRVFVPVAVVFTLLSIGPPMNIAEASMGTKIALSVMHIVAAVAIVGAIVRRGRRTT